MLSLPSLADSLFLAGEALLTPRTTVFSVVALSSIGERFSKGAKVLVGSSVAPENPARRSCRPISRPSVRISPARERERSYSGQRRRRCRPCWLPGRGGPQGGRARPGGRRWPCPFALECNRGN